MQPAARGRGDAGGLSVLSRAPLQGCRPTNIDVTGVSREPCAVWVGARCLSMRVICGVFVSLSLARGSAGPCGLRKRRGVGRGVRADFVTWRGVWRIERLSRVRAAPRL